LVLLLCSSWCGVVGVGKGLGGASGEDVPWGASLA
jgi:hypothetical protein